MGGLVVSDGGEQQRSDMECEFRILRCAIARGFAVRDGLVNVSDYGERPAAVTTEFNLVGAQLDEAAIGVGRVGVTAAIAEHPGGNAQHWGIATGPRQRAANAFDRSLTPALVQQRPPQTTTPVCVWVAAAVY